MATPSGNDGPLTPSELTDLLSHHLRRLQNKISTLRARELVKPGRNSEVLNLALHIQEAAVKIGYSDLLASKIQANNWHNAIQFLETLLQGYLDARTERQQELLWSTLHCVLIFETIQIVCPGFVINYRDDTLESKYARIAAAMPDWSPDRAEGQREVTETTDANVESPDKSLKAPAKPKRVGFADEETELEGLGDNSGEIQHAEAPVQQPSIKQAPYPQSSSGFKSDLHSVSEPTPGVIAGTSKAGLLGDTADTPVKAFAAPNWFTPPNKGFRSQTSDATFDVKSPSAFTAREADTSKGMSGIPKNTMALAPHQKAGSKDTADALKDAVDAKNPSAPQAREADTSKVVSGISKKSMVLAPHQKARKENTAGSPKSTVDARNQGVSPSQDISTATPGSAKNTSAPPTKGHGNLPLPYDLLR